MMGQKDTEHYTVAQAEHIAENAWRDGFTWRDVESFERPSDNEMDHICRSRSIEVVSHETPITASGVSEQGIRDVIAAVVYLHEDQMDPALIDMIADYSTGKITRIQSLLVLRREHG